jgi:hypothetical protein
MAWMEKRDNAKYVKYNYKLMICLASPLQLEQIVWLSSCRNIIKVRKNFFCSSLPSYLFAFLPQFISFAPLS